MPLYKYICETCKEEEKILEEGEGFGEIVLLRPTDSRDDPINCPECSSALTRSIAPERFTTMWRSFGSHKSTFLGPSDDIYPPTKARRRKEYLETEQQRKFRKIESDLRQRELERDSMTAPKSSDVPEPGVTLKKD
jgi:DNA-directed RNA polymerase subunit RPC12/RpoP